MIVSLQSPIGAAMVEGLARVVAKDFQHVTDADQLAAAPAIANAAGSWWFADQGAPDGGDVAGPSDADAETYARQAWMWWADWGAGAKDSELLPWNDIFWTMPPSGLPWEWFSGGGYAVDWGKVRDGLLALGLSPSAPPQPFPWVTVDWTSSEAQADAQRVPWALVPWAEVPWRLVPWQALDWSKVPATADGIVAAVAATLQPGTPGPFPTPGGQGGGQQQPPAPAKKSSGLAFFGWLGVVAVTTAAVVAAVKAK